LLYEKGREKKTEMLKNFASNKVSEAGINKYRGRKSPNQKVIVEPVENPLFYKSIMKAIYTCF